MRTLEAMLRLVDPDQADHHAYGGEVQQIRVPMTDTGQRRHGTPCYARDHEAHESRLMYRAEPAVVVAVASGIDQVVGIGERGARRSRIRL
jgi:hypothetical protein